MCRLLSILFFAFFGQALLGMRGTIHLIEGDISRARGAVAIVNSANNRLEAMDAGVCGAIFRAAGERQLEEACNRHLPMQPGNSRCRTGEVLRTPSFNLQRMGVFAIIHAVGPHYNRDHDRRAWLLSEAYRNSLAEAERAGSWSIAFPLISAGHNNYPVEEAARIGITAIRDYFMQNPATRLTDVSIVVRNQATLQIVERVLLATVGPFIRVVLERQIPEQLPHLPNPVQPARQSQQIPIVLPQRQNRQIVPSSDSNKMFYVVAACAAVSAFGWFAWNKFSQSGSQKEEKAKS